MTPDLALSLPDDLGDTPRYWIEAVPVTHDRLIEAIIDRSPGDVLVRGHPGDDAIDLSSLAGIVPHEDVTNAATARDSLRSRAAGRWLIVRDPDLVDPATRSVLQTLARRPDTAIIAVAPPGPPEQAGALRDILHADGRVIVDDPLDDRTYEQLVIAVAPSIDDGSLAALAHRTGRRRHLLEPLLAAAEAAEIETPGSGDGVLGSTPQGLVELITRAARLLPAPVRAPLAALAVAGVSAAADATATMRAHGLVDEDGAAFPAVADALVATLSEADLGRLADTVVDLANNQALDGIAALESLERIGRAPDRAAILVDTTGRVLVASEPWRTLAWIDLLSPAARSTPELISLHVRALAMVGRMSEALTLADRGSDIDARLVTAAGLAHGARLMAAAAAYDSADPDDTTGIGAPLLGTPSRVAVGHAAAVPPDHEPRGVTGIAAREFARATTEILEDSQSALSRLAEASALASTADLTLWPDTPHAILAMLQTLRHDHDGAALTIGDAVRGDIGGAPFRNRHRAITGWVALRAGRWADARATVDELESEAMGLRDRMLLVALDIALLRRGNDVHGLETALPTAVDLTRGHPPDLVSLPAHLEIAQAIVRTGGAVSGLPLLGQLAEFVSLAPVDPWQITVGFHRHLAGLVAADARLFDGLPAATGSSVYDRFNRSAAAVARGLIATEELSSLADELVSIGLVHEAQLLVAYAALQCSNVADAKKLLTLGRRLRARLPGRGADESTGIGALSEREIEVAHELLAGHTYKEIGSRLYISPKTVEHHVAHIKTKLAATSRAEVLAALRSGLDRM